MVQVNHSSSGLSSSQLIPNPPNRINWLLFHINLLDSKSYVGGLARRVGFYAFMLPTLASLRQDIRTYGLNAAREAINRAPKEAFSQGVKHFIVNYAVPNARYAAALILFASCIGASYVAMNFFNPWLDTGADAFQKAKGHFDANLSELKNLLALVNESRDAPETSTKTSIEQRETWNNLLRTFSGIKLSLNLTKKREPRESEELGPSLDTYANLLIKNIFFAVQDMYAAARKSCPYKTLDEFVKSPHCL